MRTILIFVLAAVAAAGTVGILCGTIGLLLTRTIPVTPLALRFVIIGVAAAYGMAMVCGTRWPVPTRHWQVPRAWGRHGKALFAVIFGAILGAGFFTIVNFIGYYLLLAICVSSADPWHAGAVMAIYGASRAVPLLLAPLVFWVRGKSYTAETTDAFPRQFKAYDVRMDLPRAAVLLALAGSMLAQGGWWH